MRELLERLKSIADRVRTAADPGLAMRCRKSSAASDVVR
jgi:hypothetical protein